MSNWNILLTSFSQINFPRGSNSSCIGSKTLKKSCISLSCWFVKHQGSITILDGNVLVVVCRPEIFVITSVVK